MRVLLVNQFYPPDPAPTGQFLQDLASSLVRRGHAVRVLCSRQWYSEERRRQARHDDGDVDVRRLRAFGFGRGTKVGRVIDYLSFYVMATVHALFGPRPHVVVCLTTPPYIGFVGLALRLFRGTRFIQWVMDLYPDAMIAHGMVRDGSATCRLLRWLTSRLFRGADLIWALGPFARDRILIYLPAGSSEKVRTIPLWADVSLKPLRPDDNALRDEYGCNGRFAVMYSGNMGLGHEFDTFIEAATRLQGEPGIVFVFVGGGTRAVEVQRKVKEYALPNVVFRPYAPRERLGESLSTGDVHILSQLCEWQGSIVPSKLAGIFAAGRPAIFVGGDQNEISTWIREAQAGYVVPIGDSRGLVQAIEHLYSNLDFRRRLGSNARAFYERRLAPEVNIPKLVELVELVAQTSNR